VLTTTPEPFTLTIVKAEPRIDTGWAIRAASMLKQACAEIQNRGAA
jgi:hypothetical protein